MTRTMDPSLLPAGLPAAVVVDLDAIRDNVAVLRERSGAAELMAVVKADAYGHGMVKVAKAALSAGASFLGVATPEEGVLLRESGMGAPVLIFGALSRGGAGAAVEYGLTQAVCRPEMIPWLARECDRQNKDAFVHLKIDTGMGRIGVRSLDEAHAVLNALKASPRVKLTGAFTHFADADGETETFTRRQLEKFLQMCEILPEGILLHAANSAAALMRTPRTGSDRSGETRGHACSAGTLSSMSMAPIRTIGSASLRPARARSMVDGDTCEASAVSRLARAIEGVSLILALAARSAAALALPVQAASSASAKPWKDRKSTRLNSSH